jgi:hypothetical protein
MKEYKNPKKISNNAKGSLEENEAIEKSQFLSNNIDGQLAWQAQPLLYTSYSSWRYGNL